MKTDSSAYMVTYVAVMGIAVAVLLTGVGRFTAPRKAANEASEKIRNVLQVFGVAVDPVADARTVKAIYDRNVRMEAAAGAPRYLYQPEGAASPLAIAVNFEGPGLWGPVKGFLAMEPDMTTVRGITVYQQEETPGLGGDIAGEPFCRRFVGRKIVSSEGEVGLRVTAPGKAADLNEVDGITGATMTCRKVEAMLTAAAKGIKEAQR